MAGTVQSARESLSRAGERTARAGSEADRQRGADSSGNGSGEESGSRSGEARQPSDASGATLAGETSRPGAGAEPRASNGWGRGTANGPAGASQPPLPVAANPEALRGRRSEGGSAEGSRRSREFLGAPDPTRDRAAYYRVVPERLRAQEAALSREEIPESYKRQVREYFDSIRSPE